LPNRARWWFLFAFSAILIYKITHVLLRPRDRIHGLLLYLLWLHAIWRGEAEFVTIKVLHLALIDPTARLQIAPVGF
jgi:hypothetical protein